jgi:hypothetical protein
MRFQSSKVGIEERRLMRSDLIFGAQAHIKNRYQLCQLTSLATRKLHRPTIRVQDTTNDVLVRFRKADPAAPSARTNSAKINTVEHRAA